MQFAGPELVIAMLLLVAAASDFVWRVIPDAVSISIGASGLLLQFGHGWVALVSLALAVCLFFALVPIAVRGLLGGGDVKLASAVALALPPAALWDFIFAATLAGGVLGLAYLAGPVLAPRLPVIAGAPLPRRLLAIEAWRLRRGGPLPYGVAIACGGILVVLGSPGH